MLSVVRCKFLSRPSLRKLTMTDGTPCLLLLLIVTFWFTMAMLVLVSILVVIGMIMDPYGAVVLVSVSIAGIAYQAGIDPVHFWMVTLVAFELGYLSPPVAVNHLLTRQVVGEQEIEKAKEETRGKSFWIRHERYVLPLTVMGIALVLVAFGPLVYQQYF